MALGCKVQNQDRSEITFPGQRWNEESRSLVNQSNGLQSNKVPMTETETK